MAFPLWPFSYCAINCSSTYSGNCIVTMKMTCEHVFLFCELSFYFLDNFLWSTMFKFFWWSPNVLLSLVAGIRSKNHFLIQYQRDSHLLYVNCLTVSATTSGLVKFWPGPDPFVKVIFFCWRSWCLCQCPSTILWSRCFPGVWGATPVNLHTCVECAKKV